MKKTIADLVDGLCRRCQLTPNKATPFVQEMFNQIVAGLESDKIVKVRGLGTFKLLTVEERVSTDVNSGERIVIPEHFKMTFTPDGVLRDEVNKPFADFESVEINEDTPIEALMGTGEEGDYEAESGKENEGESGKENEGETTNGNHRGETAMHTTADPQPEITPPADMTPPAPESAEAESPVAENPVAEAVVAEIPVTAAPVSDTIAAATQEQEVEPEPEPESVREPEPEPEPAQKLAWGALEGDDRVEDTSADFIERPRSYGLAVFCTVIALLAGYFVGSFYPLKSMMAKINKRPVEYLGEGPDLTHTAEFDTTTATPVTAGAKSQAAQTEAAQTEAVQTEAAQAKSGETAATKAQGQAAAESPEGWPQVEGGEFWIVGEIGKDTMKVGKNLLRISKRHYGSDKYVPYICVMNSIANPDIVPLNKELRLPKLRRKE